MTMFGERVNEDALRGKAGRPFRDYAYVIATDQNFDRVSWFDVVNDRWAVGSFFAGLIFWTVGVPFGLAPLWLWLFALGRFGFRYWAYHPSQRKDGERHCLVVYEADGFWHVAEHVRGKGELVHVLSDGDDAMRATTARHILETVANAKWGDCSTTDAPRQVSRSIKTYKRRGSGRWPLTMYPRTSVGFAAHVLGIHDPRLRTPSDLLDYCERAAVPEEKAQSAMEPALG